ncbi:MAG TPA: hypothetical protein PLV45_06105 [bacterium]|nr:hypothetical protein [bacterium]
MKHCMVWIVTVEVCTVCLLFSAVACELQLHGYDMMGDGWEGSSVTVRVDDEIIIEDWYVADSEHDMISFTMDPGRLVIEPTGGDDSHDNMIRLTDADDHRIVLVRYFSNGPQSLDITCDLADTLVLAECMTGYAGDEPVCSDGYIDLTNGGCDAPGREFSTIQCGETVCGTLGRFDDGGEWSVDSDWYEVFLDHYAPLKVGVRMDYPGVLTLYDHGNCSNPVELKAAYVYSSAGFTSDILAPGTYSIRVASDPQWYEPCGGSNIYTLSVGCCDDRYSVDIDEAESACEAYYTDTVNGGCDTGTGEFTLFFCNVNVTGQAGFHATDDGPAADTDWYVVDLLEPDRPVLRAYAEFPAEIVLYSGDCGSLSEICALDIEPCGHVEHDVGEELEAGQVLVRVAPQGARGVRCDSRYMFQLYTDDLGDSVNSAQVIDVSELFEEEDTKLSVTGDTRFATNRYDGPDYGVSADLSGPEWVGRIQPSGDIMIRLETIRSDWPSRLIVTRGWPPRDVWYSSEYRGFDRGGFDPLPMTAGEDYYIFIDGASDAAGNFILEISDSEDLTEIYDVSIDAEEYNYDSGDTLRIYSTIDNPYNETVSLQQCLCIEYSDMFWFFPEFSMEFATTAVTFGPGTTRNLEFSTVLDYDVEASVYFVFYYTLLEIEPTGALIFRSNIDVEYVYLNSRSDTARAGDLK